MHCYITLCNHWKLIMSKFFSSLHSYIILIISDYFTFYLNFSYGIRILLKKQLVYYNELLLLVLLYIDFKIEAKQETCYLTKFGKNINKILRREGHTSKICFITQNPIKAL